MPVELPPRLYSADALYVHTPRCVEVRLNLRFGVSLSKNILLEGIDTKAIPSRFKGAAQRSLVLLVMSKRSTLFVQADDTKQDGYLNGRIFVHRNKWYHKPHGLVRPRDIDVDLLEVSAYYQWLGREHQYDDTIVKMHLNGTVPETAK